MRGVDSQHLTRALAQADMRPQLSIQLPRVASSELLLFDASAEGHVSEVRWSAFQFLLTEIGEVWLPTLQALNLRPQGSCEARCSSYASPGPEP